MKKLIKKILGISTDFNSADYWEKRYKSGGTSGDGSYGKLASFKADFINDFIKKHHIHSAIEFGCGDGNQLSMIDYREYLGLDVSSSIITSCKERFKQDASKTFRIYDDETFAGKIIKQADLTLSLDVIYHIIEEGVYRKYLADLFNASHKYVIIYSTNFDKAETTHVLHREFLSYVQKNIPSFQLTDQTLNKFPGLGEQESMAHFYIFKKVES